MEARIIGGLLTLLAGLIALLVDNWFALPHASGLRPSVATVVVVGFLGQVSFISGVRMLIWRQP